MPESSPVARLTDIVEAAEILRKELEEVTLDAFETDRRKRWVVERGVEIISEASRHLPGEMKARHPDIPWPKVAGIGKRRVPCACGRCTLCAACESPGCRDKIAVYSENT